MNIFPRQISELNGAHPFHRLRITTVSLLKKCSVVACVVMAILGTGTASAQGLGSRDEYFPRHDDDVYFGLRLGVLSTTVNSDDEQLDGGKAQTGLNLGIVAGFQLSPEVPIYLEAGLSYAEKGGKRYDETGKKVTYDLNYLQLPIVAKYKFDTGYDIFIEPFVGGYFAYGIGGKMKNFTDRTVSSSFSDNRFQRFDGGLRIGCGAEYSMIYVELGYDFGLSNISHDYFDSSHNGAFFANFGVNF